MSCRLDVNWDLVCFPLFDCTVSGLLKSLTPKKPGRAPDVAPLWAWDNMLVLGTYSAVVLSGLVPDMGRRPAQLWSGKVDGKTLNCAHHLEATCSKLVQNGGGLAASSGEDRHHSQLPAIHLLPLLRAIAFGQGLARLLPVCNFKAWQFGTSDELALCVGLFRTINSLAATSQMAVNQLVRVLSVHEEVDSLNYQ